MAKIRPKLKVRETLKVNKEQVDDEELNPPGWYTFEPGEVHSRVAVKLGYLKSRDWQTVSMDVTVEVPTPLGKEKAGLKLATEYADDWLTANEDSVEAALRGLV